MRFFFYGTLRSELAPPEISAVLGRGRRLAHGTIRGRLFALGSHPAGIPDPDSPTTIAGEVIEFPDDGTVLRKLDAYEEFDPESPEESLFVRRIVTVRLADDRTLPCWTYAYNRDVSGATPILGGDYARWNSASLDGSDVPMRP